MYFMLDIIMVLLIVICAICGYKRGFFNFLATTLTVVVLFVLAIAGGAGLLLLFYKINAVDNLAYAFLGLLGETNSLFGMLGITSYDASQLLSALVFFLIGMILSSVIFVMLSWQLKKVYDKIPTTGAVGVVSGVLGLILYVALFLVFVWALLGLVYTFAGKGAEFCVRIGNFFNSCTVTKWLYQGNPFNGLFASLF